MIFDSDRRIVFDTNVAAFGKGMGYYQAELLDLLQGPSRASTISACFEEALWLYTPEDWVEDGLVTEYDFASCEFSEQLFPHRDDLLSFLAPYTYLFDVSRKRPYTAVDASLAAFALELSKDEPVDFLSEDRRLCACLQYCSTYRERLKIPIDIGGVRVLTLVREDELFHPIFDLDPPRSLEGVYNQLGI